MALSRVLVPHLCGVGASIRRPPHCYITRLMESALCRAIFQASRSLRSFNHTRLGEERVRGLVHGFIIFCLLASYAAAETPPPVSEEISAIIQTEIMAMTELTDTDIRVEITGGIRDIAPGESFRLAPKGLTIGRRNVIAPIEVIREGRTVRSMSVTAVVHVSVPAVVAARRIASGETITELHIRESRIETTDVNIVLSRAPEEFVGKVARRAFAVGDSLPPDAFSEPVLIRRGDTVNLRLERGGISVSSAGRALENGRFGEVIRVRNEDFSSEVRARVTGRSEVSIQ
jgi:flagella basal body P-ring formation protein FlgA